MILKTIRNRTAWWSTVITIVTTTYGISVYKPLVKHLTLPTNLDATDSSFDSGHFVKGQALLRCWKWWGICNHSSKRVTAMRRWREGYENTSKIYSPRQLGIKEGLWEENRLLNHGRVGISWWRRQNEAGCTESQWTRLVWIRDGQRETGWPWEGRLHSSPGWNQKGLEFQAKQRPDMENNGETMKGFKQGGEMIKYAATLHCSQVGTLIFFLKSPSYSHASGGYIFRGDWALS